MLNVVIIGYGGMGEHHANLIQEDNIFNIVGVYDVKTQRQECAKKSGFKAYKSLDEVCLDTNVHIGLIATPNDTHKKIACKLMNFKKHVICEKPVALNCDELREMIQTSEDNCVKFTVNQNRRFDTDFLTTKNIYKSRELGDMFKIESMVMGSRGIPGDWRGKKEHGGGMLFDWGIHMLDQISLLIEAKLETVYCTFTNVSNDVVDDGFCVILKYDDGLQVTVECSTCNFLNTNRWQLYGNNGSAYIKQWQETGETRVVKSWKNKDVKPVKASSGFTKTMAPRKDDEDDVVVSNVKFIPGDCKEIYRNFAKAVEDDDDLIISHSSLVKVLNIIEKCFESVERNEVIKL